MDDKILKHKLESLKNSRKLYENLSKKQNSKSVPKPNIDENKSKTNNFFKKINLIKLFKQ